MYQKFSFLFCFALLVNLLSSCDSPESTSQNEAASTQNFSPETTTPTNEYYVINSEQDWDASLKDDLQVALTHQGTGNFVKKGNLVKVHYRGLLWVDGKRDKQFDSSFDRGEPVEFSIGIGQVIPGWDKSIVGQRIGTKLTAIIPPALAYGEQGFRDAIPANSTLIFDVEILDSYPAYITIENESSWDKSKSTRLQLCVTKQGSGTEIKPGDRIKVHYRGQKWLGDKRGDEFDSSYNRGEPAEFPIGVGRVIRGWDLGLVGQKIGTKLTLIIPQNLGYGGRKGLNDMIFDVEILGVSQ